ncbi:PPE family protein [Mycolicibacter sinensis]|jgi:PPE-repeat protein|uniref:Ribulose phosphate epimerase n=1 Tax=Mycolicibacter sinensis (strain JDM601) TaxID=875328 RepID=A0A1A2DRF3_MYCSD|nr:PPE family protein [Mycolicibacter sinensis]OBF95792.1 ribulose phosphate epimerase [Mycolicibacter sinensis]OBG05508.1 ribulose phosphate epimerase [Mycolicibacter sinensis]
MDFGALPPEINSGRMYSGPGAGPLLAAAAAWDALAAELNATASSYHSVVTSLAQVWSGPTAATMSAAAQPYAGWMGSTAAQAQQSAAQARAAAAAYESAFAATVPPPVIAANRSLLLALIATNILGQNTAAIAATELEYTQMWAQDAGAMYGYAGASASATALSPFATPPQTTNPAGLQAQSAAATQAAAGAGAQAQSSLTQLISTVPQALQNMAVSGAAQAEPTSILDFLAGPLSPISLFGIGGIPYLLAIQCVLLPMNGANVVSAVNRAIGPKPWLEEPKAFPAGALAGSRLAGAPVVSAGLGNGASIGRMTVPQGWIAHTPTAKAVAAVFPEAGPQAVAAVAAEGESGLVGDLALGSLAGRAMAVSRGTAGRDVGGATGLAAASKPSKPSKATIIVIPPSAED